MGQGPLGLPKLHLVAKVQFWQFVRGPKLTNVGIFFPKLLCLARMSSNVTKTGQHGSGFHRPPKTTLGCKSSILVIRDERRHFYPKLLCLARMLSNVTKTGQHGSGFLGLRKLYLVAKVQFWQFATGPKLTNVGVIFQSCST